MQLAAVKNDGYAIHFIENPSEAVQLAAVKQNGNAIQYIKNPSASVKTLLKDDRKRYRLAETRNQNP
jgi:hypothetical protein